MNKYKKEFLSNQVPLITVPVKGAKTTTALVIFKTGSKNETRETSGISHFLEHMFFKGTNKRPNTLALSSEMDSLGGEYNAFTSKEYTGYWFKVVNNKLPKALNILSDMLFNSKFDEIEIEREKGVIIEELNMYKDNPRMHIEDVFETCLYGDTPAGWETIGTKENIKKFTRQDFLDYLNQQYGSRSAYIIISGAIKPIDKKLIKKLFAGFQNNKYKNKQKLVERQISPKLVVSPKKTDQLTLALGVRTVKIDHPDEFKLKLLSIILGGSMSSRLFINLRERKGLAYYVRASAEFLSDSGYLSAQAGVPRDKIEAAIKIILQEFKQLKTELVTAKELKRAKDILQGRVFLQMEASDNLANWYAQQVLYRKKILTPGEMIKKIKQITPRDIKNMAQKIFINKNLNLAIIGDVNERKNQRDFEILNFKHKVMSKELLEKLNKGQKQAVTHNNGPLLIVAGAGTGKTTVLINRLAHLITENKVRSDDILLLTFTEKAASEMEGRADKILPYGYVDLWINTFHSFGERLLREHALDVGLSANFKLIIETEQWVLIKKNIEKFKLDYYRPLGNPTKFISELLRHFSRLKDENISAQEYLDYANSLPEEDSNDNNKDNSDVLEKTRVKELASAYVTYNKLLLENDYLDFGDLIIYTLKLLTERPNILKYYRTKFRYIMVDEFQDTNWAQYELIKLLAAPRNNLVVVGDDDQAIYKFRGASISNIMQFKDDFPGAQEIVLTENYRSRQEILDHAYKFIQHNNPNRLEDKLLINKRLISKGVFNQTKDKIRPVNFYNFETAADELSFVAQKILEIHETESSKGTTVSWSDFAILIRANNTADAYVKELNRYNIPNQFMSWRGLYYKPLILDILAYFRLLDNYHESSALFRVLNMNIFKVSHLDLITINKIAARKVWSLYEALKNIEVIKGLSAETYRNVAKLLNLINQHSLLAAKEKPTSIFLKFAYDSGLLADLDPDRDLELYSYLNQFYQKIKRLEENEVDLRLNDFLQTINLELEAGETGSLKLDFADNETVKIMTVHGAKGLEFKYVFMVNLVDKKFPTIARGEKISLPDALIREQVVTGPNVHIEEERRLFYVAITRAKEFLCLSGAKDYGGAREKKPSRFIDEMGLVSVITPEIKLSQKNEFLRDLHYLNSREIVSTDSKTKAEDYPLPEKFSFSQLAAFLTCPLQYKFAFVLKIPASTDKASLIFGRVLHNTLYNFLLPVLSERQKMTNTLFGDLEKSDSQKKIKEHLNIHRLLEIYEEFWQTDGYPSKRDREQYKQKGLDALHKFWQGYSSNPPHEIIYLEKKFSFKVYGDIIKGAIDRIDKLADGSLEIIDYKTGKTKTKLDYSGKRQLILYQMFIEEFLNVKVGVLSYYYLESGDKFTFSATDKDVAKLKLEIRAEIAAIKKREFPPKPSMMCSFCDFNSICEFRQV